MPSQWTQQEPIQQHAKHGHASNCQQQPDPIGQLEDLDEGQAEESPHHHDLTMGEVHDIGGLVDQDKAQCHQGVDATYCDSTDKLLQEFVHQVR